jgi:hypothetical protein
MSRHDLLTRLNTWARAGGSGRHLVFVLVMLVLSPLHLGRLVVRAFRRTWPR